MKSSRDFPREQPSQRLRRAVDDEIVPSVGLCYAQGASRVTQLDTRGALLRGTPTQGIGQLFERDANVPHNALEDGLLRLLTREEDA